MRTATITFLVFFLLLGILTACRGQEAVPLRPTPTDDAAATAIAYALYTSTPAPTLPPDAATAIAGLVNPPPPSTSTPAHTSTPVPTAIPVSSPTSQPAFTTVSTATPAPTATPTPTPRPSTAYLAQWGRIKNARWIDRNWPDFARQLKAYSWVRDGIDGAEAEGLEDIFQIENKSTAKAFVALPWVQDGIQATEVASIDDWVDIENKNEAEALRIARMPFLRTLEPPDAVALGNLADWIWFEPDTYRRIMAHPTLAGGITDALARIVAVLWSGQDKDISSLLLDLNSVNVQERNIKLPHTGAVELVVMRLKKTSGTAVMDALEHAARSLEAYMGLPLPSAYIAIVYADAFHAWDSPAGTNYASHIVLKPEYDMDARKTDWFPGFLIAHELAHYYWRGNSFWVDEGIAETLAILIENKRSGRPIAVTGDHPCTLVSTIPELESRIDSQGESAALDECGYHLGEQLFLGLYSELGDLRFGEGLRRLYLRSQSQNQELGLKQVREAFKPGDVALDDAVDKIVDRWSE